jgi:hypothetical protein
MVKMAQARIQRFERGKLYNSSEIFAANESNKESYLTALLELIVKLEDNAKAYYAGMDYSRNPNELKRSVTFGDKWDKVWTMRDGEKANIVCWIDANTGLIYKPNGVSAPYPKPRADIYDEESFKYADPHGGWLYKNFDAEKKSMRNSILWSNKERSTKEVLEHGEGKMSR